MADKIFDNLTPPASVTNPDGAPLGTAFPRHLHADDGSYVEVTSEDDMAAKLEEGYTLEPQVNLDGTPFAKDVAAKAAADRKTKAEKKAKA